MMDRIDYDAQYSRAQVADKQSAINLAGEVENLTPFDQVRLPDSSDLLNLGKQAHLIELFPMAAYAVRAPDGVIAWFNSQAAQLWGRVPVVGDTDERFCGAYKLYQADGTPMAHCDTPVALTLTTGNSVHGQEVVIEKPDGSRVIVSVHIDPIRDPKGGIVGVVNFFRDISEQKQTERATGLLAAIVGSSDDAIVSKNLDGVITSWNKGAERIFGYTAEEAVGKHISLIIPADRQDEETEILRRIRAGHRVDHFETVRQRKDGTLLDISATISPLKDSTGRTIGASKVARDISQRKQSELALRQSEERFRKLAETLAAEGRVRTEELEKLNREVLTQAEQVRQLSWQLLRTQDEERRHIARELHDSAGQTLAVLGMNLATIIRNARTQAPEIVETAEQTHEMLQELTKKIRTTPYFF